MWIKICANTTLDDALLAVEAGADAVGFVFAPSKRQVTAAQVAAITAKLPPEVEKVGVFTSTDAEEIVHCAAEAGLTVVQLHSRFDSALVDAIVAKRRGRLEILQVLDVPEDASVELLAAGLREASIHPHVFAVLLDASHGGMSGGTGKPFDWDRLGAVVLDVQRETGAQIVIAGGLRAENVADAITQFEPWGVDVASGVEARPGTKDMGKVRAFIIAARDAGTTTA